MRSIIFSLLFSNVVGRYVCPPHDYCMYHISNSKPLCFNAKLDYYTEPTLEGTLLSDQELIAALPENGWTTVDCNNAYFGCTLRDADNYNLWANINDDTCSFGNACELMRNTDYTLIDTRMTPIYEYEHFPCAINLPIMELRNNFYQTTKQLFKDTPFLIQCGKLEGTWAAEVKDLMVRNSFTNVTNIGGYNSLRKIGCECPNV